MVKDDTTYVFTIKEHIKQSRPGFRPPRIEFKAFSDNPNICNLCLVLKHILHSQDVFFFGICFLLYFFKFSAGHGFWPNICVVSTLNEYIDRTAVLQGEHKQLLLSYAKPFKLVTVNTISRWLKLVLVQAGIDHRYRKPRLLTVA